MDYTSSIILGLVQGLTEFLPVSSSGHLILAQHILGLRGPQLAIDLWLHLGTTLALLIYFRRDLGAILQSVARPSSDPTGRRMLLMIVVASIPTAILGLAFEKQFEALFGDVFWVCITLFVTALLLFITDRMPAKSEAHAGVNWLQSLIVGIAQGIAIIPGISRSGATIAAGVLCGLGRDTAARFSFLISIPAILGACLLEAKDMARVSSADVMPYLVGVAIAFIVGYLSIDVLMKMVVKRRLIIFAIYLTVVGALGLII